MPKLLKLVPKTDPVLRETIPEEKNLNDTELKEIIADMCYSILPDQLRKAEVHDNAAGMAANQWGLRRRIFIYTPDGSAPEHKREIMINPSYHPYLRDNETVPTMVAAYEGCFSIPLTTAVVNRYEAIIANYTTPEGEQIQRVIEGWDARVFQHETDHLNGKLYDGRLDNYAGPECADRVTFNSEEEMDAYFESKRQAAVNKS